MITTAIIVLASVLIGYLLGSIRDPKEQIKYNWKNLAQSINNEVEKRSIHNQASGSIRRPSAQELYERNRPKQEQEALDAMKEGLDEVPELLAAKEQVAKMKSAGTWIPQPQEELI